MFKQTLLALSLAAASTAALALPNIAVLATGGTIAGAGASSTGSAYKAGAVSVNHLVAARQDCERDAYPGDQYWLSGYV